MKLSKDFDFSCLKRSPQSSNIKLGVLDVSFFNKINLRRSTMCHRKCFLERNLSQEGVIHLAQWNYKSSTTSPYFWAVFSSWSSRGIIYSPFLIVVFLHWYPFTIGEFHFMFSIISTHPLRWNMACGNMNKAWAWKQWISTKWKHALHTFYLYVAHLEQNGPQMRLTFQPCDWLTCPNSHICYVSGQRFTPMLKGPSSFHCAMLAFFTLYGWYFFYALKVLLVNDPDGFLEDIFTLCCTSSSQSWKFKIKMTVLSLMILKQN